jgi:hypothetical protein
MGARIVVINADKPVYNESTATEAITPGMLVNRASSTTVEKNDLVGDGNGVVEVAVENDIFGGGIDDNYAAGDTVISQILQTGCEFMGLVNAGAAAITYDAYLTPAAGGFLAVGTRLNAVAMARQAVDNSGGGAPARIRALVL